MSKRPRKAVDKPPALTEAQAHLPWSAIDSPGRWAKRLDIDRKTLRRRIKDGTLRARYLSSKRIMLCLYDLPYELLPPGFNPHS